jgi:hypothetical protein
MNKTLDNIYFVDSELTEQVRQNLMCIFLENLVSHQFVEINWDSFVNQWRLGIAESILENPHRVLEPKGLESVVRLELDLRLLEFQIDGLNERDKASLCRMWYPEALGDLAFNGFTMKQVILLPLSLIHGVTLLNLFNRQLVNGKKLLSDDILDSYCLELDAYKSIETVFEIPLSEMNILSADEESRNALEILGLKKNDLYHQVIKKQVVFNHALNMIA